MLDLYLIFSEFVSEGDLNISLGGETCEDKFGFSFSNIPAISRWVTPEMSFTQCLIVREIEAVPSV